MQGFFQVYNTPRLWGPGLPGFELVSEYAGLCRQVNVPQSQKKSYILV